MTQGIFFILMLLMVILGPQSIMVTWEKGSLRDTTFVPKLSLHVKTIQLQRFLIVFNDHGKLSELIFAFDLSEMKWLKTRLYGDEFEIRSDSSVCLYDAETIVMFGMSSDEKEDVLNIMSLNKGSNGKGYSLDVILRKDS